MVTLFGCPVGQRAQSTDLEELMASEYGVTPSLEFVEVLEQQPLQLRKSGWRTIAGLPGISAALAKRICKASARTSLPSPAELADSLCLGESQKMLLMRCTSLDSLPQNPWNLLMRSTTMHSFDTIKGTHAYLGSPMDNLWRLKVSSPYGDFFLAMRKYPGEKSPGVMPRSAVWRQWGDYKVILGDFTLSSGLGLLFGGVERRSKVSDPVSFVSWRNANVAPWTSSVRAGNFRGMAISHAGEYVNLTAFFSSIYMSARVDSIERVVTSINDWPVVSSSTEENRTNAFTISSAGASISTDVYGISITANMLGIRNSLPVASTPYGTVQGADGILFSTGICGNVAEGVTLQGELIVDQAKRLGSAVSATYLRAKTTISMLLRSYAARLHSPYGAGPAEASKASNETGVMLHYSHKSRSWNYFRGYVDVYVSNYRTHFIPGIQRGVDVLFEYADVFGKLGYVLRLRYASESVGLRLTQSNRTQAFTKEGLNFRLDCSHKIPSSITLGFRVEHRFNVTEGIENTAQSTLTSVKATWTPTGALSIGLQHFLWTVESGAPLYAFVYLAPGNLASQRLSGNGYRSIIRASYRVASFRVNVAYTAKRILYDSPQVQAKGEYDRRLLLSLEYATTLSYNN